MKETSASDRSRSGSTGRSAPSETFLVIAPAGAIAKRRLAAIEQEFPHVTVTRVSLLRQACLRVQPPVSLILIEPGSLHEIAHCAPALQRSHPSASIAAITKTSSLPGPVIGAVRANTIKGIVPMDLPQSVWLSVLDILRKGLPYFPSSVLRTVSPPSEAIHRRLITLTERENRVLELLARGLPSKKIAGELALSEHTVKIHIHHIFAKLGVRTRTEAAAMYHSRHP